MKIHKDGAADMSRLTKKMTTPLTAIALSGFVVLSGCGGGRRPERARQNQDYEVASRRPVPMPGAGPETRPSRAVVTAAAAAAPSVPATNGDVFHGSLAFPTGVRETSVLLLEKTAPRKCGSASRTATSCA